MAERMRYVKIDGTHVAYQVVGEGDLDVVFLPGWFSDVATARQTPGLASFISALTRMGRLILFDKPGMGSSDRLAPDRLPSLGQRTQVVTAVMDEVGSDRAALVGISEGGSYALAAAAQHPDRVSHVVAISAWVCVSRDVDPDIGVDPALVHGFARRAARQWGTGSLAAVLAPSQGDDPLFRSSWAEMERRAGSPQAVEAYGTMVADLDIRAALPQVVAPTLVIHSARDRMVPVAQGRHLGANVAGARYVELDSGDHVPLFDAAADRVLDEIQLHLRGDAPDHAWERRLATVVFTDIVDSTIRVAGEGDAGWKRRLDAYDELAQDLAARHGGRVVKSTGDGTLMVFDDPSAALRSLGYLHREAVETLGVSLRAGVHMGQVELRGTDIGGIAVHLAARVTGLAGSRQTLVSRTVRDVLLGESIAFDPAGVHELRGIPGIWELFEVA